MTSAVTKSRGVKPKKKDKLASKVKSREMKKKKKGKNVAKVAEFQKSKKKGNIAQNVVSPRLRRPELAGPAMLGLPFQRCWVCLLVSILGDTTCGKCLNELRLCF